MPNLVGTGLNQVPTNSMLGGLAYQDPEHASIKNLDLKNLSQINSEIADTAVDVFVYDTRKDSDGGAWRKRTSHTSWYNETLETTTRGSRREFPAVAVIVADVSTDKVTIYDGDDPDLPLWMKFNSGNMLPPNTSPPTSVAALNGDIMIGFGNDGTTRGCGVVKFVSDTAYWWRSTNATFAGNYTGGGIINRNSSGSYDGSQPTRIKNNTVNDVAMTVLPNAPIDDTTGLPIPTIAVATDNGVSVIKDDGSVVDAVGTTFDVVNSISFDNKNRIICSSGTGGTDQAFFSTFAIPSSDLSNVFPGGENGYYRNGHSSTDLPWYGSGGSAGNHSINEVSNYGNDIAFGTEDDGSTSTPGLKIISENVTSPANGMLCGVSTSYNTGYMFGDIKGAFLSDTTIESLTANTNLASSATQTATARLTSETYTDGATSWQMVDNAGNDNGYLQITFGGLTTGQSYNLSMTVDANAALDAGYEHKLELAGSIIYLTHWNGTGAGTLTTTFEAISGQNNLIFYANGITVNVTNFNIRAVDDEDRSVNNNGLQVFGTIAKTPVATGADLVAYSGFDSGNYLRYNASDMAFGTGDFSVSLWCIPSTDQSNEFILELDDASEGSNRFYFLVTNTTTKRLYLPWDSDVAGSELIDGKWNHVVVGRKSGYGFVYVNNQWIADGYKAWSTSLNGNGLGTIGNYSVGPSNDYGWSGSLALLRISGSAPSAEQVKKMYEDEKVLFHENAKATLYGSSDAVTALAFDDTTNLLHVGTSAGRSEFQGLRRINNTTDAVTTAISASNGLVAEQ